MSLIDVERALPEALEAHPAVSGVRLVGSREIGRAHALSDWDFLVFTDALPEVAHDLPRLVAPLEPLSELWDPYSDRACYMLMLRGPTKVDLIFPREKRAWSGPWEPSAETLADIDRHFWDWILWLEQKRRGGRKQRLEKSLGDMYRLLLRPMGASAEPLSVADATTAYVLARDELEERFGVEIDRILEREVAPVVTSAGRERL
jgi:predicted nucleotidyltransferase